jgi:hypothetical protein
MDVEALFEIRNHNPRFLCRDGPARGRGAPCSNKKLCFTGTDRADVARHLYELSLREDCFFVKFSTNPRGGMFLGRCFLATDAAVGEVWAMFKDHPTLFCTVQDDEFVEPFRELEAKYEQHWARRAGT